MSERILSQAVRDLILRHIGSVAHLEALLFFRAHPGERLDAQSVARRLYAPGTEMVAALKELTADGFLNLEHGVYTYAPSQKYDSRIDAMADAYANQLIAITNLIHEKRATSRRSAFKLQEDR